MRNLLVGLVLGAAATVAVLYGLDGRPSSEPASDPDTGRAIDRGLVSEEEPPPLEVEPTSQSERPVLRGSVKDGLAALHVGEGLRLDDGVLVADDADLRLVDVSGGARFACPHGAGRADLPVGALQRPGTAAAMSERVHDAPPDLGEPFLLLAPRPGVGDAAVGFVTSAAGLAFKVWLQGIEDHDEVLRRRVLIRFEPVERREGGGVVDLPTATVPDQPPMTEQDLRRIVALARAVPQSGGTGNSLVGRFDVLDRPFETLKLDNRKRLFVPFPIEGELGIEGGAAVVAGAGLGSASRVAVGFTSSMAVRGDQDGTTTMAHGAYLHISGDLRGRLEMGFHAVVVVDGDVRGTLVMGTHAKALVRGRLLGTLEVKGKHHPKLLLHEYMTRADVEALEGSRDHGILYVRDSELDAGEHRGVGGWHTVRVGDALWEQVPR